MSGTRTHQRTEKETPRPEQGADQTTQTPPREQLKRDRKADQRGAEDQGEAFAGKPATPGVKGE